MEIHIPFKTPSVNHLYFNYNGRRILTKEARELKLKIKEIVNSKKILAIEFKDRKLSVRVSIYEDWFCKNGSVKKVDVSNREKFLIDAVFDGLELDDKFIFKESIQKVQSEVFDRAVIEMEVIKDD